MGSWLQLSAFLTDIPCENDKWREQPIIAARCEKCYLCVDNCPTGAIQKDRFLLYREKCKNCPECQKFCPMNKEIVE
jgi:epoxyqueuosine reductase